MSDARFIWTAWISNIILFKKEKIQLYRFFKNGKQLRINNLLADKLINIVINWSLGSYFCEKQLNKYKENIWQRT